MSNFADLIQSGKNQKEIAAYLDNLTHEERIREVESVPGSLQSPLFQIATADLKLSEMFPATAKPLEEVIFYGKNSLPLFNIFQKRMCRATGDGLKIWGYNHQTFQKITGPGCFVVTDDTDRPGEVMIDYTRLPESSPSGWPAVKSNESGITKLVYGSMKDYMRRVSKNVFIGEATKKGKKIGQYFILCRK